MLVVSKNSINFALQQRNETQKKRKNVNERRKQTAKGVVLEWLKRHAWKACIRQKRIPSSNLGHSAKEHAENQ